MTQGHETTPRLLNTGVVMAIVAGVADLWIAVHGAKPVLGAVVGRHLLSVSTALYSVAALCFGGSMLRGEPISVTTDGVFDRMDFLGIVLSMNTITLSLVVVYSRVIVDTRFVAWWSLCFAAPYFGLVWVFQWAEPTRQLKKKVQRLSRR